LRKPGRLRERGVEEQEFLAGPNTQKKPPDGVFSVAVGLPGKSHFLQTIA